MNLKNLNKSLPAMTTLLAGAITCVITIRIRYPIKEAMTTILVSMLVFYVIGLIAQTIIGSNIRVMEEREAARIAEEKRLEEEERQRLEEEERLEKEQQDEAAVE